MKIILFLISLFFVQVSTAQDTIHVVETDSLRMTEPQYVDSAFGSLDSNKISTKFLIDRVPGLIQTNKEMITCKLVK